MVTWPIGLFALGDPSRKWPCFSAIFALGSGRGQIEAHAETKGAGAGPRPAIASGGQAASRTSVHRGGR